MLSTPQTGPHNKGKGDPVTENGQYPPNAGTWEFARRNRLKGVVFKKTILRIKGVESAEFAIVPLLEKSKLVFFHTQRRKTHVLRSPFGRQIPSFLSPKPSIFGLGKNQFFDNTAKEGICADCPSPRQRMKGFGVTFSQ